MDYEEEILERIKDSSKWPEFDRTEHLNTLHQMAREAMNSDESYAPLSAILIYQQLTEESLRLLLNFSHFFVQGRMWPWKIEFKELKGAMFGRVIEELKKGIEFQNRNEIILLSNELNEIRIQAVHGLTKLESTDVLRSKAVEVETKFNEIFKLYEEADEYFRFSLKDLKQSLEWDRQFEE